MNNKGYAARLEYSEEDNLFVGHIAGIRDVVRLPWQLSGGAASSIR